MPDKMMNVLAENTLTALLSILICGVLDIRDAVSIMIALVCVCVACGAFLVARDYRRGQFRFRGGWR